jgi:hypothetical protein
MAINRASMARGTYQDFNKVDVKVESVVAELVDNSIAREGVTRIDVVFKQDSDRIRIGKHLPHQVIPVTEDFSHRFSMSVFNDGKGFESVEKLHSSFELVKESGQEIDRRDNETGKFHIGMKESTLNKFHHFSIIANIGDEQKIRSIIFPGHENEFVYDWEHYPALGTNPSNILPNHVDEAWINRYMQQNNFITCGHASAAKEPLCLEGVPNKTDIHFLQEFADTITNFLGIIYSQDLIDEKYELNVVTIDAGGISTPRKVKPIDMFWEQTTPDKIRFMATTPGLTDYQKYLCETLYGYGTLEGHSKEIEVDFEGVLTKFKVTPFLLPHEQIRDKLQEISNTWNKYKLLNDPESALNSGNIFKSESLQGCTFIRSGRTIVIGNHNSADNDGYYKLFAYGFSTANTKTRLRIKIEYDKNPYTDRLFDLKPNKDGYKEIRSTVWKKIIVALKSPVNGRSRGHFFPHDREVPFFVAGDTNRHYVGKVNQQEKWFGKKAVKICSAPGCRTFHGKNQDCPKRPCVTCDSSLYSSECTPTTCMHICENPECGERGHTREKCPLNICENCNQQICICCSECNANPCICVCSDCNMSPCECEESMPTPPPPTPRPGMEDDMYGRFKTMRYYPDNKENTVEAIKAIMNDADVSIEDLQ